MKSLIFVGLGALAGLFAGWAAHNSRYGKVAEFGPFSVENDLEATNVAAYLKSKTQQGSPRIEVIGGEEYDFGVMEPGSKGEHKFVVKNVGEFPLSLEIVGSTCKCTIGKLEQSSIGPGEQTEIQLAWDVKSTGEDFGQSAILKTNDPTRGELHLKVKGRVISQMTMVPRSFSFGEVASGEAVKLESIIYCFEKEPIVPVKQSFSDPAMTELTTFAVEEVSKDEITDEVYSAATQAFKVSMEIRPGLPQGAIQQNFLFGFTKKSSATDSASEELEVENSFFVPIAGRVVGAISMVETSKCQAYQGSYVYTIPRGDPATATPERANVMLRGAYKDSVKLSLGSVEPAGLLNAELGEPVGRGSVMLYPLRLWVNPEAKSGERIGKNDEDFGVVTIQTDNPDLSPLKLKVRFAVVK
jgi:hypothetical protein